MAFNSCVDLDKSVFNSMQIREAVKAFTRDNGIAYGSA